MLTIALIFSIIFLLNSFPSSISSKPAVSYNINSNFPKFALSALLSLVTPGISATIAAFLFISLLNKVDLPTLGRPKITTLGNITIPIDKLLILRLRYKKLYAH